MRIECNISERTLLEFAEDNLLASCFKMTKATKARTNEKKKIDNKNIPPKILDSRNRSEAGFSVPASGLILTNITYNQKFIKIWKK